MSAFFRLALGGILLGIAWAPAQEAPRQPHEWLQRHFGFSDKELRRVDEGKAVAKSLKTSDRSEIAVCGVVWLDAPASFYLDRYRDITTFLRGKGFQQVGKMGDPPRAKDLSKLTLPTGDVDALRKCKVGDCAVKVGEEWLKRLRSEVDWDAPDAHQRAETVFRTLLLERTRRYLDAGNAALAPYRDKKHPIRVGIEFRRLLENSPYLADYAPELQSYLRDYPGIALPGSNDFFYWSRVQFGLKPTIRVNHIVIFPIPGSGSAEAVAASKTLYASHYIRGSLDFRLLLQDSARPEAEGVYLVSLNSSRVDGFGGLFGNLVRAVIVRRTRNGLRRYLSYRKRNLEEQYSTRGEGSLGDASY